MGRIACALDPVGMGRSLLRGTSYHNCACRTPRFDCRRDHRPVACCHKLLLAQPTHRSTRWSLECHKGRNDLHGSLSGTHELGSLTTCHTCLHMQTWNGLQAGKALVVLLCRSGMRLGRGCCRRDSFQGGKEVHSVHECRFRASCARSTHHKNVAASSVKTQAPQIDHSSTCTEAYYSQHNYSCNWGMSTKRRLYWSCHCLDH